MIKHVIKLENGAYWCPNRPNHQTTVLKEAPSFDSEYSAALANSFIGLENYSIVMVEVIFPVEGGPSIVTEL